MKYICVFALFVFNISCVTLNKHKGMRVEKMAIAFQDFFENDTVSISLNDCQLFENKVLNSVKEIGYTGITLWIDNQNEILLGSTVLNTPCRVDLNSENKVSVVLNGNIETFIIDLNKGVYIGFDKKEDHLYLIQSTMPFEYD